MPDLEKLVEKLSSLTVLQASELSKMLEEKWGVSAAAPVAMQQQQTTNAGGGEAVAEKTSFNVMLSSAGAKKLEVIKEVRVITGLGLKEAKDLVDSAPKSIKDNVSKEDAEKIKKQLEAAGATIELK